MLKYLYCKYWLLHCDSLFYTSATNSLDICKTSTHTITGFTWTWLINQQAVCCKRWSDVEDFKFRSHWFTCFNLMTLYCELQWFTFLKDDFTPHAQIILDILKFSVSVLSRVLEWTWETVNLTQCFYLLNKWKRHETERKKAVWYFKLINMHINMVLVRPQTSSCLMLEEKYSCIVYWWAWLDRMTAQSETRDPSQN